LSAHMEKKNIKVIRGDRIGIKREFSLMF